MVSNGRELCNIIMIMIWLLLKLHRLLTCTMYLIEYIHSITTNVLLLNLHFFISSAYEKGNLTSLLVRGSKLPADSFFCYRNVHI